MTHGHFITKCKVCERTMNQCRCMSKDKTVKYEVCDGCAKKEK